MSTPLQGIRVVELSTFVAGPVTARLLGDMGATIIKVEAPGGDGWRGTGTSYLPRFAENENPVFDIYNSGKQHISLNLKTPEGKDAMHRLLEQADVFVTNTRPAALKRLGFDYDTIKERYPALIYAMVLGYGEAGPDAHKPAFDTTAFWSRSGFLRDMSVKHEKYAPVTAPSSVGDTATAYLLMGEICAALYRRSRTGTGDFVSSTLYHNGIFCMGTMAIVTQPPFGRTYPMNRVDAGVPGGNYECADGEWIFFAMGNPAINRPKFHRIIGYPELDTDPRFQSGATWANRYEYYEYFRKGFLTKTADEWVKIADEEDLPLVRMAHFKDISTDEQAWANGFLEHVTFGSGNTDIMPSSPIEMRSAQVPPTRPAPAVGADTAKILLSLGYSEEQVQAMIATGAAVAAKEGKA